MDSVASRAVRALRAPHNWLQLARFCAVGASGYAINLAVYTALLKWADLHYLGAAFFSFLVAVTNNYWWNRHWTFRGQKGHFAYQGMRFAVVSAVALVREPRHPPRARGARRREGLAQAIAIVARHAAELHRQQALVLPALT